MTKNNDAEIVGFPIPKEYEKDLNIMDPADIPYPINQIEAAKYEERVF